MSALVRYAITDMREGMCFGTAAQPKLESVTVSPMRPCVSASRASRTLACLCAQDMEALVHRRVQHGRVTEQAPRCATRGPPAAQHTLPHGRSPA